MSLLDISKHVGVKITRLNIDIYIVIYPIDINRVKLIKNAVESTGYYLSPEFIANQANKLQMNAECYLNIANAFMDQKHMISGFRMCDNSFVLKLCTDYENYPDIMLMSKAYKVAPMFALKKIFEHKYGKRIKVIFTRDICPESMLSGVDLEQFCIACRNDSETPQEIISRHAESANMERRFVEWCKITFNTKIITEAELKKQQIQIHGTPILTPDVVFEQPQIINEHLVHWLDYKNYFGSTKLRLHRRDLKKSQQYNQAFGIGFLCYGDGIEKNTIGSIDFSQIKLTFPP